MYLLLNLYFPAMHDSHGESNDFSLQVAETGVLILVSVFSATYGSHGEAKILCF